MQGIFVGTFLIGLREGLEAALIVGIVAAFLKRNGKSVRPMLAGVGVAVAISIAGGVALNLLSETLPQRQQEMLETVIGAIAVVFVTTMIIWMNRNASALKCELEREAQQAITTGGSLALATMAFLAVLKEGFETAVFLLAAAQTSGGNHDARPGDDELVPDEQVDAVVPHGRQRGQRVPDAPLGGQLVRPERGGVVQLDDGVRRAREDHLSAHLDRLSRQVSQHVGLALAKPLFSLRLENLADAATGTRLQVGVRVDAFPAQRRRQQPRDGRLSRPPGPDQEDPFCLPLITHH